MESEQWRLVRDRDDDSLRILETNPLASTSSYPRRYTPAGQVPQPRCEPRLSTRAVTADFRYPHQPAFFTMGDLHLSTPPHSDDDQPLQLTILPTTASERARAPSEGSTVGR